MTASTGPQQAPQPDSFAGAVERAQRDYARLLYVHAPTWSIDLTGTVAWTCSCTSPGPRNAEANDRHIKEAVRKARGPIRAPRK